MGRDRDDNGGSRRGNPNPDLVVNYKDTKQLKRFISEDGKILPRRRTGLNAKNQRRITTAVKRARHLALLPYATRD
ncbi:MAG: 30S ribosomal protein S18 [Proteobacteria bacterium]|nr:30S ribosomal protein S18 [Pseudomonadota bacterium]